MHSLQQQVRCLLIQIIIMVWGSKNKQFVIIICLLVLTSALDFPLSLWKNYHLDSPYLVFTHSELPYVIELPDILNAQFESKYYYAEEAVVIEYSSAKRNITVVSYNHSIGIYGVSNGQGIRVSKNIQASTQYELLFGKIFERVQYQTVQTQTQKLLISCDCDMLVLQKKGTNLLNQWNANLLKIRSLSEDKLNNWLTTQSINSTHYPFASEMLSHTMSMLCKEGTNNHIGLCDLAHFGTKHAKHQIDLRYSFLIIDLLRAEYAQTALFLFEHVIDLLEDRLFYQEGEFKFLPIPEHVQLFKFYSETAKKEGSRLKLFSIRVKAVLNGLINQMLLSQVNHIEQQMNYRQTNKLHPTLYKMLNMKWKATSPKHEISSVYEQSFTPDYFYNYPNQTVDTCVSKLAWLFKATVEYHDLVKTIGDEDDIASLQQPISLLKVLNYFIKGDQESQQGRFYSINDIGGGVRIYAKHVGYETLLPYIYELSERFPQNLLQNITTKFGIASLNIDHPKMNTHYEYRGNIHSYFNYKILFTAKKVVAKYQNKYELNKVNLYSNTLLANIRQFILNEWANGRTFTMWSPQGTGLRHRKQLSLINVALLKEQ